ncbi:MAG: UDP-N-acetylmuramoyl-L-alanine--D-glutamate ligase [Hyphomicrobiales bacterium]
MFPATSFRGKKVAVFGLARSGTACIEALRIGGASVHAWDDSPEAVAKAQAAGLPVADLRNLDFAGFDALVLSPGVPLTHPEPHWAVVKAHAAGIEAIGDTEVFQRELSGSGARLVAITGTNGKSTTAALIGHLFRAAGRDADVGGNIGTAVFLMRPPVETRVYVLELSSFQIDLMPGLKPDAGILINVTPDHLDRHGTMENYAAVKARIFARQSAGDWAMCGVDDRWCAAIADGIHSGATLRRVSVLRYLANGISAPDGVLRDTRNGQEKARIDLTPMPALKGAHNWQNACMAYGAARALGLHAAEIRSGFKSFPGLAHRMQEVARAGGVAFVNDSKATNADAAEKALSSFETIYWIAGGIAKAGGIEPLRALFPRVAKAYLIGEAAEEFARTLRGKTPVEHCGTLDRAVAAAARDAIAGRRKGAVVLLSPACASFDHYPNFEVRGDAFVAAVARLPGAIMKTQGADDAVKP